LWDQCLFKTDGPETSQQSRSLRFRNENGGMEHHWSGDLCAAGACLA
jgi:hypothetical protein